MTQITYDTPEDPAEPRLTLDELRAALVGPKFKRKPDTKTVYRWLGQPQPCPCKINPGSAGKGRCTRRFLLSHVLAWLDDPAAYYGKRRKAS
jgi:hypothetical protein